MDVPRCLIGNSSFTPAAVFFRDEERSVVSLSPDGHQIAWLERRYRVRNLVVASIEDVANSRQLTFETRRPLAPILLWSYTNNHIIIFRDRDGDENYRAFSVNVTDGSTIPLTPAGPVASFCWKRSPIFPSHMLFGLNARDPRVFDVIRVNVTTGEAKPIFENPGFSDLHISSTFDVQLAERVRRDGIVEVLRRQANGNWKPYLSIPAEDALSTKIERLSRDGRSVFLRDSRGRDKAALYDVDLTTGTHTLLAEDQDADVMGSIYNPDTDRPLAAIAVAARQRWYPIDDAFRSDLERILANAGNAEVTIVGIGPGMKRVLFSIDRSDSPGEFRVYDGHARRAFSLFKNRSDLERVSLRPMHSVSIASRDGLRLPSYLSIPHDDFRNGPLVVVIHGGPYARDFWGFSATHQWLTSRGYGVLSVNFRGSTGFGKRFLNAAAGEWGRRMQDDLVDAAKWAIDLGYADPQRIALFGVSYGGYAALMAITKAPDVFACAINAFGPSNLATFIHNIPSYWSTWFPIITRHLVNPDTEEGRTWLAEHSPITHVDRIFRPILIAQGLNDVRVNAKDSEQMVQALRQRGIPFCYVTFQDEGHVLEREDNRIAFSAAIEAFLAKYLGGGIGPVDDSFTRSPIQIDHGGGLIQRPNKDGR